MATTSAVSVATGDVWTLLYTAAGTVTAAQSGRAPSRFANARDVAMKKASAIKGSPVMGPKKPAAQKFDSAFAAAKKAGKKEFTWKGKKYNTKVK
jgi:hypothetical protein